MKKQTESKFHFEHRSRMDIIACILENSNDRSRKTRIIYGCNLSLSQFNIYKDYMVETGLLETSRLEEGGEIFETTEKGKEFLKDYEKIKSLMNRMSLWKDANL